MKLRIGFSKPKDKKFPIFSWLIRAYERTPFSHVYLRWQTSRKQWICYHAASIMVHFLGEYAFGRRIKIVEEYEIEISDSQYGELLQFCFNYCGADYALSEVLKIPLWDLGIIKYSPQTPYIQYCAELVGRAFEDIGYGVLTDSPDRVKLKTVYEYVKSRGVRVC